MSDKILGKEDIFPLNDLPIEKVFVEEWHGAVYVRTLTAAEKDAYQQSLFRFDREGNRKPAMDNATGRLGVLVICDASSRRIFADDDASELGRKSPKALERILKVARKLNGLDEDAIEEAKGN